MVVIVNDIGLIDHPVATEFQTRLAPLWTGIGGFNLLTVGRATVTTDLIAVIANLKFLVEGSVGVNSISA